MRDKLIAALALVLLMAAVAFTSDEWTGANSFQRASMANLTKPLNAVGSGSEVAVWTPTSLRRFRLLGYCLVCSEAGNVLIRNGLAGTIVAVVPSAAGGPCTPVDLGGYGVLGTAVDAVLTVDAPGTGTVSGTLWGTEELR